MENFDSTLIALKQFFENKGLKNVDIARALGVSAGTVSNMLSGHDSLGHKRAYALQKAFGISAAHLLAGQGVIELQNTGATSDPAPVAITRDAEIAALRAENTQLRQQVEWLRGIIENSVKK